MSSIDSLGASTLSAAQTSGFSAMTSEDFTKIIFTELSKQDPLQPNDSSQLLQQISMIRGIQADIDLTDKIKGIATQNEFAAAAGLIGKYVSGITDDGRRVSETVMAVARTTSGPVLTLATADRVAIANVDQILESNPDAFSGKGDE